MIQPHIYVCTHINTGVAAGAAAPGPSRGWWSPAAPWRQPQARGGFRLVFGLFMCIVVYTCFFLTLFVRLILAGSGSFALCACGVLTSKRDEAVRTVMTSNMFVAQLFRTTPQSQTLTLKRREGRVLARLLRARAEF